MSRCFPYPPPGYERKIRDEGLIESIKKEREKAKKERRKEKKRDKKEKNEKFGDNAMTEEKKHANEKRHTDERSQVIHPKDGYHTKGVAEETEQAEKSCLTEEREQLAAIQSHYDSSDSTQNSAKRKRHDPAANACHYQGNGLRIRFPLHKHKDPELPKDEQQPCSSGLIELNDLKLRSNEQKPCSSGRTEISLNYLESAAQKMEAQFRDLIVNWNPPPPSQFEHPDFDTLEWLFERKQPLKQQAKRCKVAGATNSSCNVTVCLQPRACYLAEADIYSLPYVLPY
ncbi:uncharacterized protein LOC143864238 [Tasmannia lanceolata]|uniref:uncharacterized protein LOC143864238 n=1 Tax=Tasmannia lanceolata TaxID=3420 RepID=UPI004063C234